MGPSACVLVSLPIDDSGTEGGTESADEADWGETTDGSEGSSSEGVDEGETTGGWEDSSTEGVDDGWEGSSSEGVDDGWEGSSSEGVDEGETTDGLVCEDLQAQYEEQISTTACETDWDCKLVHGHCGVGLGGCWHAVNAGVDQAFLNSLAIEWDELGCLEGGVCDCPEPPAAAVCSEQGVCVGLEQVPCEPMDAVGVGDCDAEFGVAWDGAQCVSISGCECVGTDCAIAYASFEDCEAANAECNEPVPCEAQDAEAVGACEIALGVFWNGAQCVMLSGCECVGADCADSYPSLEACEDANAECTAQEEGALRALHLFDFNIEGDVGLASQGLLFAGVAQGQSTEYTSVNPGPGVIEIYPSGSLTPWATAPIEISSGHQHTVAIAGAFPDMHFVVIDEGNDAVPVGVRRIRFAHARSELAGPVDLWSMGPDPAVVAESIPLWAHVSVDLDAQDDVIAIDYEQDGVPDALFPINGFSPGSATNLYISDLGGEQLFVQTFDSITGQIAPF
ncbi:hypothetical protein PPSIR1_33851 [Plesiocystis pacifica SIR-1]|uniref:DUF4397 domain-containing protein n=1 Tax=Plesiocystis pacifica SIR-1 TaxID=391625 RepID=A6GBN7_9BACT|nr:hypothetical protein PPSIR1_33851 [Plesiocystis pacifica SIR-1]